MSATGKFIWPIADKGLKKRIHRIKAPTLIVWGEKDGLIPPVYGTLFQKSIKGSKLVTISGAGHVPMVEQPEAFLEAVAEFLS
jgi:pimeloyl-ACP methyl ester carboxylesterase